MQGTQERWRRKRTKEDGVVAEGEMVDVEVGEEVGGAMVGTLIVTIKETKIIIIYYNLFVLARVHKERRVSNCPMLPVTCLRRVF